MQSQFGPSGPTVPGDPEAAGLPAELRDRVLERLGFREPPAVDLAGLRSLYAAWCLAVPFDNVRKVMALRAGDARRLPGGDAVEFFRSWLEDGAGGTCWPTSNALYALVRAVGFEARRVVASMRDLGVVNHGSVRVQVEDGTWLVDSSWMCNVPLPLGEQVFVQDGAFPIEVEPVDGTHVVWSHTPPNPSYLPCRLFAEPVGHTEFLQRYEDSRARSPFNQRLYARINRPGELLLLVGNTRWSRTATSLDRRELSAEELRQALLRDIGLSEGLIEEWARSGALQASFEPPAGPKPPAVTGVPPSPRPSAT
jgi:arylamine N-acetyltransferase